MAHPFRPFVKGTEPTVSIAASQIAPATYSFSHAVAAATCPNSPRQNAETNATTATRITLGVQVGLPSFISNQNKGAAISVPTPTPIQRPKTETDSDLMNAPLAVADL